jgi:hypothetical protein
MLFSDRFPQGSRSTTGASEVRGEEESAKLDSRSLIPSVKDIMISSGKHSQLMNSVKNSDTINEFIALYGYGHPANVEEDGRTLFVSLKFGLR